MCQGSPRCAPSASCLPSSFLTSQEHWVHLPFPSIFKHPSLSCETAMPSWVSSCPSSSSFLAGFPGCHSPWPWMVECQRLGVGPFVISDLAHSPKGISPSRGRERSPPVWWLQMVSSHDFSHSSKITYPASYLALLPEYYLNVECPKQSFLFLSPPNAFLPSDIYISTNSTFSP